MADKSRFAPAVLIEFELLSHRLSEPFRRILFIAPKIDVGEVHIKSKMKRRTTKAVFVGNVRQKPLRIVDVYFVGIEFAPPVSGRCDASVGFQISPRSSSVKVRSSWPTISILEFFLASSCTVSHVPSALALSNTNILSLQA